MPSELGDCLNGPVRRFLLRCTVGLYTCDWLGVPRIVGSAVCLECKSGYSLITAAHVLGTDLKKGLYLRPGEKHDALISLHQCRIATLHKQDRHVDLAVILLSSEIAGRFHPNTYWLDGEDILDDEAVDLDFWPGNSVGIKGRKVSQPTPKGLSGGGIWILTERPTKQSPVMLVGIQHRWHKTLHSLRGTRIVGLTEEIEPAHREVK